MRKSTSMARERKMNVQNKSHKEQTAAERTRRVSRRKLNAADSSNRRMT